MGLFFRNRQVAGNICLVVFLAFMFTLLPGQFLTANAYATTPTSGQVTAATFANLTPNADTSKTTSVEIDNVTSADFQTTIAALVSNVTFNGVNNLVYKITYQKDVTNVVYSVYLWVYNGVSSGTLGSQIYKLVYSGGNREITIPVRVEPPRGGSHTTTPTPPVTPPVTPPTTVKEPAEQASVVAEIATNKPTVAQTKQLEVINVALGKLSVPSASDRVITVGKSKVFIPELVITSSKVVVIMPLTSTTLDPKAVNYKIGVVKAYLAAQGIKGIPVRFVFLNTNPKLKVSVKAGSYFSVETPKTLVKAINSTIDNKAVVANKANVMKAFGIKVLKK